jgi:hypothetical protein
MYSCGIFSVLNAQLNLFTESLLAQVIQHFQRLGFQPKNRSTLGIKLSWVLLTFELRIDKSAGAKMLSFEIPPLIIYARDKGDRSHLR